MKHFSLKKTVAPTAAALAVIAGLFCPLVARADDEIVLTFTAGDGHSMQVDGGHLKIDGQFVDFKKGDDAKGTVACINATSCTITLESTDVPGKLNYNAADQFTLYESGNPWSTDSDIDSSKSFAVQDFEDDNNNDPFDGSVYFVWNCNGNFCYDEISGISPAGHDAKGYLTYDVKYVPESSITGLDLSKLDTINGDGKDHQFLYHTASNLAAFASLTTWNDYMNWKAPQDPSDFAWDTCGAKSGKNSISTNGDRAFRLTIYSDDNYYGILNKTSSSDRYYPDFWANDFNNPELDISGTTAENPVVLMSYLSNHYLQKIQFGNSPRSAAIKKIEVADDTPTSIIFINQEEKSIAFGSSYYDQILIKITDMDDHEYFVLLARNIIFLQDHGAWAKLYLPTDDSNNYDVYAHVTTKGGKTYSKKVNRDTSRDNGDAGVRLQSLAYDLSTTFNSSEVTFAPGNKQPVEIVFIISKAGGTIDSYAGTLSGVGKGTGYTINPNNGEVSIKIRKTE